MSLASVRSVGPSTVDSPLGLGRPGGASWVPDDAGVIQHIERRASEPAAEGLLFEKAGPRAKLFFRPQATRAAILTAGGICPGTNNVIRALVHELIHRYGITEVLGVRSGFAGLDPASGAPPPRPLTLDQVRFIHTHGGTLLGTSRGGHDPATMLETLLAHRIDVLFAIGGDGTMRGTHALAEEATRRGIPLAVVAIPKTIDDDIPLVDRTFGFETAVSTARAVIDAAHTEALSTAGGIGLVKTMGREAGFIAAHATLASVDVNVCLVPEIPFRLAPLLAFLEDRARVRGHAVVVVAEGCGAGLEGGAGRDASGNVSFSDASVDIGRRLKRAITEHLASRGVAHSVKYIDPSYLLRGVAAEANDSAYCAQLARGAVHAAMAGRTDLMVGRLHGVFVHVPLPLVLSEKKRLQPDGDLWLSVLETTGQPSFL